MVAYAEDQSAMIAYDGASQAIFKSFFAPAEEVAIEVSNIRAAESEDGDENEAEMRVEFPPSPITFYGASSIVSSPLSSLSGASSPAAALSTPTLDHDDYWNTQLHQFHPFESIFAGAGSATLAPLTDYTLPAYASSAYDSSSYSSSSEIDEYDPSSTGSSPFIDRAPAPPNSLHSELGQELPIPNFSLGTWLFDSDATPKASHFTASRYPSMDSYDMGYADDRVQAMMMIGHRDQPSDGGGGLEAWNRILRHVGVGAAREGLTLPLLPDVDEAMGRGY